MSNLSWGVDLRTHPIANMIEKVLADPWPPAEELGREVPEAVPQDDDCIVSFIFQRMEFPLSSFHICRLQKIPVSTTDTAYRNVTAGNLEISTSLKDIPGVACLPGPTSVLAEYLALYFILRTFSIRQMTISAICAIRKAPSNPTTR